MTRTELKPTHKKITLGFVVQTYSGSKCIKQEFVAGDVNYEDLNGNPCQVAYNLEEYFPFDMVQPSSRYQLIHVFSGVEPTTVGEYETYDEMLTAARQFIEDGEFSAEQDTLMYLENGVSNSFTDDELGIET